MSEFTTFFSQNSRITNRQRYEIERVLARGEATVTEITEKTEIPKDRVVWNILGLLRWGIVEVTGEREEELIYALKEV